MRSLPLRWPGWDFLAGTVDAQGRVWQCHEAKGLAVVVGDLDDGDALEGVHDDALRPGRPAAVGPPKFDSPEVQFRPAWSVVFSGTGGSGVAAGSSR